MSSPGVAAPLEINSGEKWSPDPSFEQGGAKHAYCSVGAVGHDASGRLVMITAAHCTKYTTPDDVEHVYEPGSPVYLHSNPDTPIGHVTAQRDFEGDWAVIELDPKVVKPSQTTLNGMHVDHVGADPALFQVVCKDGATSGKTCGAVTQNTGKEIFNFAFINGGDSGGVLLDTTSGAVGFTSSFTIGGGMGVFKFINLHGVMKQLNAQGSDAVGAGFTIS